jgi:putative peptide maturation dehydrogenase
MQVRRCAVLWLEPREVSQFELDNLLSGGTGVVSKRAWFAHAPHLPEAIEVSAEEAMLLGTLSPTDWVAGDDARVPALLEHGLLIADVGHDTHRDGDARLRAQHWYGLSSVWHAASRWTGVDAAREVQEAGMDTALGLRTAYGAPPAVFHERGESEARIPLARTPHASLDTLLDQRSTCRNFDTSRELPQPQFAHMLERVFASRGQVHAADDFDVIKRTSPSGGALHPTEAYLIVRHVEGIAPGLYHYRPGDHSLQPMPPVDDIDHLAFYAVGGQQWFAEAHVLVVLAPRFGRNFWKYRNHSKAYRVTILDVGHLSQTLLLSATDLGLGSFVTAAINEGDIEEAFGLTSYVDGPLAVCGFGIRSETMTTSELDPNRTVWPQKA